MRTAVRGFFFSGRGRNTRCSRDWSSDLCSSDLPPKTRQDYWGPKLARNQERDAEVMEKMAQLGWSVDIVWQCELRNTAVLMERLVGFLGPPRSEERRVGKECKSRGSPDY